MFKCSYAYFFSLVLWFPYYQDLLLPFHFFLAFLLPECFFYSLNVPKWKIKTKKKKKKSISGNVFSRTDYFCLHFLRIFFSHCCQLQSFHYIWTLLAVWEKKNPFQDYELSLGTMSFLWVFSTFSTTAAQMI